MSHTQIEIYVRSSPLGEVGIHWRNISKPEQPSEEPMVLKERVIVRDDERKVTVNALINDTKPSLILARYENKILLELTGLDATEARSQKMGRRISEIVLWVGDVTDEVELRLRKLAGCALLSFWKQESDFLSLVRSSIDFDGLNSFKANTEKIEQLYADAETHLKRLLSKDFLEDNRCEAIWSTPNTIKIERDLYNLVSQINQTPLPKSEQPVVVVAELKRESERLQIVYKGNVWKAPEPEKKLQEIVPLEATQSTTLSKVPPPKTRLAIAGILLGMIITILVVVIIIWVMIYRKIPLLTPEPTPTPTEVPQKIRENLPPQSCPQIENRSVLCDNQSPTFQSPSPKT